MTTPTTTPPSTAPATEGAAVSLRGLTKGFGDVTVVDDARPRHRPR